MKRDLQQILFISFVSGIIVTLGVLIFLHPAYFGIFNLSEKDKLGTAISGLTAPVIGLISTVLLYLTLSKQTESNGEQRLKNESDVIFLLINQFDNEINSFRVHQVRTDAQGNKYEHPDDIGPIGIFTFSQSCANKRGHGFDLSKKIRTFDNYFESAAIILIIESYLLIEKRIHSADLSSDMKDLFQSKLRLYYNLKLKEPLEMLADAFKQYKVTEEPMPKRIIEFVKGR